MVLRITYCNTKRFLKTTIQSFKSYFSGGYQRLPKTPPCNPFSCTGSRDRAGMHATHFNLNHREPETATNHHKKTETATKEAGGNLNLKEPNLIKKQENKTKVDCENPEKDEDESSSKCFVTRKLKEFEKMDRNNIDLVLDIEEVLHYYSRLTCPVYRDIIEKFFVEMYSGTFVLSRVENSVLK
ncbi:hypothetical protein SSX86_009851 [Deinandra increscens subsp. villosa]|uniref:Uncharacterized protein n=1 Tax=Deinandra increscens subsp. villosa TaxID=3103831 RepID=A0AAP0DE48_9ASTR